MKEIDCNRVYCEHYQEDEHICCQRYTNVNQCNNMIPQLQLDQLTLIANELKRMNDQREARWKTQPKSK